MASNENFITVNNIINASTSSEYKTTTRNPTKIGVSFPLRSDNRGSVEYSNDFIKSIEDSLKQIILTRKGERVMLPNFGSYLWRVVFENDKFIAEELAKTYIVDAITEWEDRVTVEEVIVNKQDEFIDIDVIYSINNTNLPIQSFNTKLIS